MVSSNQNEKRNHRDVTDVLEVLGRYQKLQYFLVCLPAMFITMININYIFTAGDLNYRVIEIGGRNNRVLAGVIFGYSVYIGELIFACTAMLVPNWKNLIRIIYSPPILFLSYIFLVKESPRWQILNKKSDKAKETLKLAAKMNKININIQELNDLDDVKLKQKFNIHKFDKKEGLKAIFKSKEVLKRLGVASACRFSASFIYYGIMVNTVWLPGNKYTNFLLVTIMSFPGELAALYLMNRIGRKVPLIIGYVSCGVLCAASAYVPEAYTWLTITLVLLGKMLISLCLTGAITYSMELFPTSARALLTGLCAFSARTGGMLAPLTPILNMYSTVLPSLFFGGSALITGLLLIFTPETKNLPLMDTVEQINAHARTIKGMRNDKNAQGNDNRGYIDDVVTKL